MSLSLPHGGSWPRNAPSRFLDNLLPDGDTVRHRMAFDLGADSAGVFDLLKHVGGDIAGGLVLTPTDSSPRPSGGRSGSGL
ncbi:MAG: HipA N-terminal domain-containing protein [Bifidobacteriaceae bacterium]|nr:HipA N-terminal domain-containing protein [Bifidobacteriaceae bacterium]